MIRRRYRVSYVAHHRVHDVRDNHVLLATYWFEWRARARARRFNEQMHSIATAYVERY